MTPSATQLAARFAVLQHTHAVLGARSRTLAAANESVIDADRTLLLTLLESADLFLGDLPGAPLDEFETRELGIAAAQAKLVGVCEVPATGRDDGTRTLFVLYATSAGGPLAATLRVLPREVPGILEAAHAVLDGHPRQGLTPFRDQVLTARVCGTMSTPSAATTREVPWTGVQSFLVRIEEALAVARRQFEGPTAPESPVKRPTPPAR